MERYRSETGAIHPVYLPQAPVFNAHFEPNTNHRRWVHCLISGPVYKPAAMQGLMDWKTGLMPDSLTDG